MQAISKAFPSNPKYLLVVTCLGLHCAANFRKTSVAPEPSSGAPREGPAKAPATRQGMAGCARFSENGPSHNGGTV